MGRGDPQLNTEKKTDSSHFPPETTSMRKALKEGRVVLKKAAEKSSKVEDQAIYIRARLLEPKGGMTWTTCDWPIWLRTFSQ
jgi:hypothetical protein